MSIIGKKRIAVVEDDSDLALLIKDELVSNGYLVDVFFDGLPFLRHVHDKGLPHLALIDITLPSSDGFEISRQLKTLGDVPIVFISTQQSVDTIVRGLTQYADDYLRKPFDLRELSARVQRVLTRFPGFSYAESHIITIDDWLSVDFGASRVFVGGRTVSLTPTESALLYILVSNSGQAISPETLINRIWPNDEVYEDALRVHIYRLRHKLEPEPTRPHYIQTARGSGYRFMAENLTHHCLFSAPPPP